MNLMQTPFNVVAGTVAVKHGIGFASRRYLC